jgi:FkbM family methyltransferase
MRVDARKPVRRRFRASASWALLFACAAFFALSCKTSEPKKRFVFIDGGAHKGETIEAFVNAPMYAEHDWEVFSFEANPDLIPHIPVRDNVTVMNKALWVHDKGVRFHFGTTSLGGSIVKNRRTAAGREPIHVESVDFGQWLKSQFRLEDTIHVKLDIEGAEYEILKKMSEDGTIEYVDKLYVEFHSPKMKGVTREDDRALVTTIERLNIPVVVKEMATEQGRYFD